MNPKRMSLIFVVALGLLYLFLNEWTLLNVVELDVQSIEQSDQQSQLMRLKDEVRLLVAPQGLVFDYNMYRVRPVANRTAIVIRFFVDFEYDGESASYYAVYEHDVHGVDDGEYRLDIEIYYQNVDFNDTRAIPFELSPAFIKSDRQPYGAPFHLRLNVTSMPTPTERDADAGSMGIAKPYNHTNQRFSYKRRWDNRLHQHQLQSKSIDSTFDAHSHTRLRRHQPPYCVTGDSHGRWMGDEYESYECTYKRYPVALTRQCADRWRSNTVNSILLPLNRSSVRSDTPLTVMFIGASTLSMFAYGISYSFGGNRARNKELEKQLRERGTGSIVDMIEYIETYPDGPNFILMPALFNIVSKVQALADSVLFDQLDVVVLHLCLHIMCHQDGFHETPSAATEYEPLLHEMMAVLNKRVAGMAVRPAIMWRSCSNTNPKTSSYVTCAQRAYPMLAQWNWRAMQMFKTHYPQVHLVDQYSLTSSAAVRPEDGTHFTPDTAAQKNSAKVFNNLLCNDLSALSASE